MTLEIETYKFDSLVELTNVVWENCEFIVPQKLWKGDSKELIPNKWALVGEKSNNVCGIVSDRYTLMQHIDVIDMLASTLNQIYSGIECNGIVKQIGNKIIVDIKYPEYTIENAYDGKPIIYGHRFTHAPDGKSGVNGYAYFYRLICLNGMKLKSIIPETTIRESHFKNLPRNYQKALDNLIQSGNVFERVEKLVASAYEDKYTHFTYEQLWNTIAGMIGGNKKLAREIIDGLNVHNFSRYDLYNSITRYVSHNDVAISNMDKLDTFAENVLANNIELIQPIEVSA